MDSEARINVFMLQKEAHCITLNVIIRKGEKYYKKILQLCFRQNSMRVLM